MRLDYKTTLRITVGPSRRSDILSRILQLLPLTLALYGCEYLAAPYARKELDLPQSSASQNLSRYTDLSCSAIYAEIYRLFPYTYPGPTGFYDDERNAAIAATGLSFEPAFLGWAYTGTHHYMKEQTAATASSELEKLRRASALKRCWLR